MVPINISQKIYWVGAVDWDLRYFHGYMTQRGTSYNAYLIKDEKNVLVDTVKNNYLDEFVRRLKAVIDPVSLDYIVVNHAEMDHSGCLPEIMKIAPQARIIASPNGAKALLRHYHHDWDVIVVNSGESFSVGSRTLQFVHTPMVHWPDSMVTYIPEDKLLLSNDAFGQHIASNGCFDDGVGWDILYEEAAKYYSNIVYPYSERVAKALELIAKLDLEVIAPSHGVIWRSFIKDIINNYSSWSNYKTKPKALIIYDSMWGSTKTLASALREGLESSGVPVIMRFLQTNHISDILPDVLDSRLIMIGTPTLNNGMLPTVGAMLTYLKGLRPKNKIGFAFGSHGWGGQGAKEVHGALQAMGWHTPVDPFNVQYKPNNDDLVNAAGIGSKLATQVRT